MGEGGDFIGVMFSSCGRENVVLILLAWIHCVAQVLVLAG